MSRIAWALGAGALALVIGCDGDRGGADAGADATVVGTCETPTPMACGMAVASAVPLDLSANTTDYTDEMAPTCMAGNGARDVTFVFTAPVAGRYVIDTVGSSFDTVLSIQSDCSGGAVLECNDDIARGTNTQSKVEIELAACQTVLIVVDGYDARAVGQVEVHIGTAETACDDGLDNDGDGVRDCDDSDCFSSACTGDDWPMPWQDLEWEVLTLTNERRAAGAVCNGVTMPPIGPLEMDPLIRDAAREHSSDMGERAYFEHDSLDSASCGGLSDPDPCRFSDRMRFAGFMGSFPWGENIAAGQTTPASAVEAWMNSHEGHCEAIMNPEYHVIGIGYAYVDGSPFGHYWTQDFAASH
jgi:uncharacterized protein YkwD